MSVNYQMFEVYNPSVVTVMQPLPVAASNGKLNLASILTHSEIRWKIFYLFELITVFQGIFVQGAPPGLEPLIDSRQVVIQNRKPSYLYFNDPRFAALEDDRYGYSIRDGHTGLQIYSAVEGMTCFYEKKNTIINFCFDFSWFE
jgi:hypothetical protein